MAQELLLTFGNTIGELALIPGKSATFIVRVNGGIYTSTITKDLDFIIIPITKQKLTLSISSLVMAVMYKK